MRTTDQNKQNVFSATDCTATEHTITEYFLQKLNVSFHTHEIYVGRTRAEMRKKRM